MVKINTGFSKFLSHLWYVGTSQLDYLNNLDNLGPMVSPTRTFFGAVEPHRLGRVGTLLLLGVSLHPQFKYYTGL